MLALSLALALAATPPPSPADALVASIEEPTQRSLLGDVLRRNPEIRAARARALAARQVPAQERALPDPLLEAGAYVASPDGRQGMLAYEQELPPAGRRRLLAEAAGAEAHAAEADLEAARLRTLTEARELLVEIAALADLEALLREERGVLDRFGTLARARYESGEGLQGDMVRLHAEVTRADLALLEVHEERLVAALRLNALRGRPHDPEAPSLPLPELPASIPPSGELAEAAQALRPELQAALARQDAAASRIESAKRMRRPELMLRGEWMLMEGGMGERDLLGSDELGVSVGIRLPVRGRKIAAAIEQAVQEREAALAETDAASVDVALDVATASARWIILRDRLRSTEGLLEIQADESLRSVESAYSTGLAGSLELVDAERELFEVRREAVRLRAALAAIAAQIEGAVGAPLSLLNPPAPEVP